MGQTVENYCDLCGQLLYHSKGSTTVKSSDRWYWHGELSRDSESEICRDCFWVIQWLVQERKQLVESIRAKLHGKSPADQMYAAPKPISKSWISRLINKA